MDMTKQRYLVFSSDIFTYHIAYIQEGIGQYFAKGDHPVAYFPLGIEHLEALFDTEEVQIGAIGISDCDKSKAFFRQRNISYLNLSEEEPVPEIGFSIGFHHEGNKAARFFIEELGLKNLAYWGRTRIVSHARRCREFRTTAEAKGVEVQTLIQKRVPMQRFYERLPKLEKKQTEELANLLLSLPKPAGIFCANDQMALIVKILAEQVGIAVPSALSILGVGSLHRATGGWQESVSVVQLDHKKLGYESARLMETFMASGVIPDSVFMRPDNIIHRHTTLRSALNDSLVRHAINHIQAEPDISIGQLCHVMNIPRRTLEAHFLAAGKGSIGKTIEQERFQRATHLLKNSRYSIEAVASLAGYLNSRSMRRSFHRLASLSPMDYRRTLHKESL